MTLMGAGAGSKAGSAAQTCGDLRAWVIARPAFTGPALHRVLFWSSCFQAIFIPAKENCRDAVPSVELDGSLVADERQAKPWLAPVTADKALGTWIGKAMPSTRVCLLSQNGMKDQHAVRLANPGLQRYTQRA